MRELCYDEENLAIEFLNVPSPAEYPKAYQELAERHVNIIIALGTELALKSANAATSKLPIVMVAIDYDPFALGHVTSLAHPTGNVTGVYFQEIELPAKRLELAKEMMPGLQFAAVFWDSASEDQFQSLKKAGQDLGIRLFGVEIRNQPYNHSAAWEGIPAEYRGMLILPTSPVFFRYHPQIAKFTVERRIPAMFVFREWVDAGGFACARRRIRGQTGQRGYPARPTD